MLSPLPWNPRTTHRRLTSHGFSRYERDIHNAVDERVSHDCDAQVIVKDWEAEIKLRGQATAHERQIAQIQEQCAEYMRPFFKLCKRKVLDVKIAAEIREIVRRMEEREYVKA